MKIIDKTPLQDENGNIGFVQRFQGALKYGPNWYAELEGQKRIIARLMRTLEGEKGYALIRNYTLGASGIVVPITLVGPAGIFVAHVTTLRGDYTAKGDLWGTNQNGRLVPASVNLLTRTERLARALQAFIERQGIKLPVSIQPVVLAADPGLHVDSSRPLVRVVQSDAIDRWAASIVQAAPQLTREAAHELTDRILNPRPAKSQQQAPLPEARPDVQKEPREDDLHPSRASAIFNSEEDTSALDASDLGFSFDENATEPDIPPKLRESSPAQPLPKKATPRRILGMTVSQLAILGGMFIVWVCVMLIFAFIIFSNP
ncbi:MAG: hypothetical protein Kow002_04320 [Anaerolineales bacterium]